MSKKKAASTAEPVKPKAYTKDELKELAKPAFESNPTSEILFATVDGRFFLSKNYADAHKQTLAEESEIIEIEAPEEIEEPK